MYWKLMVYTKDAGRELRARIYSCKSILATYRVLALILGHLDLGRIGINYKTAENNKTFHETMLLQEGALGTSNQRDYDRGHSTRRWCLAGLCATWVVIVACAIIIAVYMTENQSYPSLRLNWDGNQTLNILRIIAAIVVTILNESLGFIHTVTLRWTLWKENRLMFNSNLRLLTRSHVSTPNGRLFNLLYFLAVAISYTSAAQLFGADLEFSIYLNLVCLSTFTGSLLAQTAITTWALCKAKDKIVTWTSNPLNNSLACLRNGSQYESNGSMRPFKRATHMFPERWKPIWPVQRQPNLFKERLSARFIVACLWIVFLISLIWAVTFSLYAKSKPTDFNYWDSIPRMAFLFSSGSGTRQLLFVICICGVQLYLTFGLHCAEVLVNATRDENVWRQAYTNREGKGVRTHQNAVLAAVTSWQTMWLAAFKVLIHWTFGLIINTDSEFNFVHVNVPPIYVLTAQTFLLPIFGCVLAFRRCIGPQPAAHGHIQTIINLVDDWGLNGEPILWGDKGQIGRIDDIEIRHAGTASSGDSLGAIRLNALYI